MQLPLSSPSTDPSLAALLFPSAPSHSPLRGPAPSPGGEPAVAGFEQLVAELQPTTPAPVATAPKGAGPGSPAPADRSGLGNAPRTFRLNPGIEQANVSKLASQVVASSGAASPAAKDAKEGVGPRSARVPAEPANESAPSDDSRAEAVVPTIIPTQTESLPVAILPASPLDTSLEAQAGADLSSLVSSSAVDAMEMDEAGSGQAEETPPFDAALTAFRRAPVGFGSESHGARLAGTSPQSGSGPGVSAAAWPEPKSGVADRPSSIVSEDTPLDGPAVVTSGGGNTRDLAPGQVLREESGAGANGLAIAQARFALNSSETERIKTRVDPSRSQQAKFAETHLASRGDLKRSEKAADKIFLPTQPEYLAEVVRTVGTGVANPHFSMLSFTNSVQPHAPTHPMGEMVTAVSEAGEITEQTSLPEATVSSAHEAVDTALDAAERMASREQRSVDLDFTVGGAKLAVRVELQGGEIRTTFRTESSDLRVALAHEWEAVARGGEGRGFHLAPPTITGTDTPARNDSFSDASSRQQERQQERESREALNLRDPDAESRSRAARSAAATPAVRIVPFSSGTSQHLHHFA